MATDLYPLTGEVFSFKIFGNQKPRGGVDRFVIRGKEENFYMRYISTGGDHLESPGSPSWGLNPQRAGPGGGQYWPGVVGAWWVASAGARGRRTISPVMTRMGERHKQSPSHLKRPDHSPLSL